ncbi:MAG TPA: tetratricopeptide repeat protein [Pyrinomonadaceae bacterium]|nr:tetratricopeptide repeat protein [Pyrinomonadaceae bacterium]
MPDQVMQLKARAPLKAFMVLTVLFALCASWFVVRWYLGNTIAEYFSPETRRLEVAQMAADWAPKDPLPHWRIGNIIQHELPPDQIAQSVAEYEKAVSLSPNDYRFWMSLGEAQEQAGDFENAEKSLRQAVRLAPAYAFPRWYLGNLLLRTDRYTEAFAELRKAGEENPELQSQLFNFAWQINKDDFEALQNAIGNTTEIRAKFSFYLIERSRFDEGLRLWNSLTESQKRENRPVADSIIGGLIKANHFHQAMNVWNDVAPGPSYRAELGKIIDGGLEGNLAHGPGAVFGWQVQSAPQLQIGIDARVGHSGSHSLRVFFQVRSNIEGVDVSQLVPVAPNTQYDFECYVQTERLESASTPIVAIADAADETTLATSGAAPSGNNNWQRITLAFKTGAKAEAVRIKISRPGCPDAPVCPIFGTVWYDDFDLKSKK